jgi:hypothetical protein
MSHYAHLNFKQMNIAQIKTDNDTNTYIIILTDYVEIFRLYSS